MAFLLSRRGRKILSSSLEMLFSLLLFLETHPRVRQTKRSRKKSGGEIENLSREVFPEQPRVLAPNAFEVFPLSDALTHSTLQRLGSKWQTESQLDVMIETEKCTEFRTVFARNLKSENSTLWAKLSLTIQAKHERGNENHSTEDNHQTPSC